MDKEARRIYMKAWRKKNKDKITLTNKEYRKKNNNKEVARAYAKIYRETNRDKIIANREKIKAHYLRNRDSILAYKKAWRAKQKKPDKIYRTNIKPKQPKIGMRIIKTKIEFSLD